MSLAARALLTKLRPQVVQSSVATINTRAFSSISWSSSHMGGDVMYRPLSSLQEALYPSDLNLTTEEALDPHSYGYRVVYPVSTSTDSSLSDEDFEYLGMNRAYDTLSQEVPIMAGESYYNASFRPEVVDEAVPLPSLSPLERSAVMESHLDWDAQLLEEEILRFIAS